MNKYMMIAIVFAVTVAFIVCMFITNKDGVKRPGDKKENYKEVMVEANKPISDEAIKALTEAEYITVEKVERVIRENSEGEYLTNYDTYLVAEFGVGGNAPIVCDYALAIAEEGFDDSKIGTMSFVDAFDFEYQKENVWELYQKLLVTNGIDGDIQNATFDAKSYESSGREIYIMNEHCSITDWLLSEDYDEILEESICYEMTTLKCDVDVPESFLVTVKFRSGNEIVTKTLYLQVAVNEWEVEEDELD